MFLAVDLHSGEQVALKAPARGDAAAEERLRWEFAALMGLQHPSLVSVRDLDRATGPGPLTDGQLFFTADFVAGLSSSEAVALASPSSRPRLLIDLIAQVASALEALHGRGLVHHDVKPENLVVQADGRVRLLDLGLAALRGSGGARGTAAYLAPEALLGGGDARVDLFALGATVFELWSGRPPYPGATVAEVARAVLAAAEPPPLVDLEGSSAPPSLKRMVRRLLARDPDRRYSSARVLIDDARRSGATLAGDSLPPDSVPPLGRPALAGRDEALGALERLVAQAQSGAAGAARVVVVVGPSGSGRSRLVEELVRRVQLRSAADGRAAAIHGPDARSALATLGVSLAPIGRARDDAEQRRAVVVAAACEALATRPALLHLSVLDDPLAAALVAAAAAGGAAPSLVLAEASPDSPALGALGDGVTRITIGPLAEAETVALVGSMRPDLDREFARAVHRAASGLPALSIELTCAAASRRRAPRPSDVAALDGDSLGALIAARVEALGDRARASVEALAVVGDAALETLAKVAGMTEAELRAGLSEARAAGVVALSTGGVGDPPPRAVLPTAAHREAIEQALSAAQKRRLHRRALALTAPDAVEARARHLVVVGPRAEAVAALLSAGDAARGRLDLAAAAAHYRLAIDSSSATRGGAGPGRLRLADVLVSTGDYRGALATLDGVVGDEAMLLGARALQRVGDVVAAEGRLRRALAVRRKTGANSGEPALRGLLGRVLISQGRAAEALAVCESIGVLAEGVAATPLLEAMGLAQLYLGQTDAAARAFSDAEARARSAGDATLLARARSLGGMVAQQRGDLAGATEAYSEALEAAREAGDLHGAAIYAQNLGASCRDQADYGRALAATEAAARDLGRLGKRAERAGALFNLGNLLASVGDLEGAERACAEAETLAHEAGAERLLAGARSLAGDLSRRRGDAEGALAAYVAAEAIACRSGDERAAGWTRLARAELLVELGRTVEAEPLLDGDAVGDAQLADALAVARLRRALASVGAPDAAVMARVDEAAVRARAALRRDSAFHAEVTLARAFARTGELERAEAAVARAVSLWEEIKMRTPEVYRDRLDDEPDARRLRALVEAARKSVSPTVTALPSAPDDARLRRLVAINKRLAGELRLGPLLELIIDAVIELTHAERGFVLLRKAGATEGDPSPLEVRIARNIDQKTIERSEGAEGIEPGAKGILSLSRSIAERAAREGVPVVTIDAAGDQRFEAARSVSDLKLRSVLAAPLIARGQVVGCLYVDHRLRPGAFGEEDVALVVEFADQAAIAVENARLYAENQRRGREVAALASQLEKEVASQRVELGELHAELRQSRAALEVRYDYRNLVGRTPRMIELFKLLDRVTDTALPVVIFGESGTGKELVARALHHNGPRAARPYVSENCAAIPETLLEAALFGHVRGAFTGADSERRGLFEIADGGTLFLDEVGEMPPSMQSKLLRVLQDGEFRRVGGERGRKVDVRIITASNRDLGRLVEEGKFREDLFYRLNVVRVVLPPLRERREDIPLLVEHFLEKQAAQSGKPQKRIARSALAKLVGYRWPGNVRELENEVTRSAALGGDTISVDDLSPQVASGEPEAAFSPDDMTLKTRVERLERLMLREALGKAGGNQSQAARLLGLSRFGLQKKLKRYAMEP